MHLKADATDVDTLLHEGVSSWDNLAKARLKAAKYSHGDYIAELDMTRDPSLLYVQTTSDPDHYTISGEPERMADCVVCVHPLEP